MILEPLKPTFKRLKAINTRKLSILRALEHEIIAKIEIQGKTLDLGGGSRASYNEIIQNNGTIDSINISPNFHPTYLADANKPWPVENAIYDNVISFNTLEHLWNDTFALSEALRVLKPGGHLPSIVPFW
jgi:SAM-dependent methyltransferase